MLGLAVDGDLAYAPAERAGLAEAVLGKGKVEGPDATARIAAAVKGLYDRTTLGDEATRPALLQKARPAELGKSTDPPRLALTQADVDAFNHRASDVARYAIPDIPRAHAICTDDPWIFGLGPDLHPEDALAVQRAAECNGEDLVSAFVCQRASLGHPNPAGARAYAAAIRMALQDLGVI